MATTTNSVAFTPSSNTNGVGAHASLYVGDLHPEVAEALLFEVFSKIGPVSSIRVCRDSVTRKSLGYAYVNYHSATDADRALNTLNFTPIKGVPCRVMWSQRDPAVRKNPVSNLFVKNLPENMDSKGLYDMFSAYGEILSCKVALNSKMESKRFGFVHYASEDSATKAIDAIAPDSGLNVQKFQRRGDRASKSFTNLYVKNVPQDWDETRFRNFFERFGEVDSALLPRDNDSRFKGFGYVNYKNHESASQVMIEANNIAHEHGITIDQFRTREERRSLKMNLFVKNLHDTVTSQDLKKMFSEIGPISSAVVMLDSATQRSRCFGFVCFEREEDGKKAIEQMNKKMIDGKPLSVHRAQTKQERAIQKQAYLEPMPMPFVYSPVAIPQQGLMFPSQIYQQGQMRPHYPIYQHQQVPMRQGVWYGHNGRQMGPHVPRGPQKSRVGSASRYQPPLTAAPIVSQNHQNADLAVAVAQESSPEGQKRVLGEQLYPLIYQYNPEHASKITGMLLEMEVPEILTLIESQFERESKIKEAIAVLSAHQVSN
jgi:polyadenylate-binding protein